MTARNVLTGIGAATIAAGSGVAAYAGGVAHEAVKDGRPSGPPHSPSMRTWLAGPAITGLGGALIGAAHAKGPFGPISGAFLGACFSAAPLTFGGLALSKYFDL